MQRRRATGVGPKCENTFTYVTFSFTFTTMNYQLLIPRPRRPCLACWHPLLATCSRTGTLVFAASRPQVCSVHTARNANEQPLKFYNVSLVWLPLRLGLNRPSVRPSDHCSQLATTAPHCRSRYARFEGTPETRRRAPMRLDHVENWLPANPCAASTQSSCSMRADRRPWRQVSSITCSASSDHELTRTVEGPQPRRARCRVRASEAAAAMAGSRLRMVSGWLLAM